LSSRLKTLSHDVLGTAQDVALSFTYNPAGQLFVRNSTNATYDWSPGVQSRTYTPDGLNRYSNVSGSNYNYDGRGNLQSDGGRTFTYDVENRLLSVSGATPLTLSYDPLGRLSQTTSGTAVTQFLYDGDRLSAEYDGTGTMLRRYVHGSGTDVPLVWYEGSTLTDRRWLHADERGSVIATSDGTGTATQYLYGPYGEPSVWNGSRFKYTGQITLPEAQLYHYKARVYDPNLGRFLQTDPVGSKDDLNLYAYVGNDPLDRTDPSGKCDDPHNVGCPTTGKPQDSSPGHADQSVKVMKQMVADAKAAGETNLQGSFNRQTTAATDGNVVSPLKPDATLQSTDAQGNPVSRLGEVPSPASKQTVATETAKINNIAAGAKPGTTVRGYVSEIGSPKVIRVSPAASGSVAAELLLGPVGIVIGAIDFALGQRAAQNRCEAPNCT
jgi:RHS repeat-associated protein